ncbi:hypothetical protein ISP15_12785 [Dyella jejuensis]|uniref:Uncharacterized protein n=1 Tax=Dyella jejuensis TaxID=1432009 RepID=A0ABW8JJC4_9GAMM
MQIMLRKSLIALALCSAAGAMAVPLQAQEINFGDLPGGTDCSTTDVNSNGTVIGECISSSDTGELSEAIYVLPGQSAPIPLPVLADGKLCNAGSIGDDGTISGDCDDADDVDQAVAWTADSSGNYTAAPSVLLPFQGAIMHLPTTAIRQAKSMLRASS